MIITTSYVLTFHGNDLDTKKIQKFKRDDPIMLVRITDSEDTFDILVVGSTPSPLELDLLDYGSSLGIAPYLDSGNLRVVKAAVLSVNVIQGKTRAKDLTRLEFYVDYEYDEGLVPVKRDGVLAFLSGNEVLDRAVIQFLDTGKLMERPYRNLYTLTRGLETSKGVFEDITFRAHFNEDFTRCRTTRTVGNVTGPLDEDERDMLIELVNHRRILLDDDEPVDPEFDE